MVTFMLNTNVPVVHFYSAAWPNIPPPLTPEGGTATLASSRAGWPLLRMVYGRANGQRVVRFLEVAIGMAQCPSPRLLFPLFIWSKIAGIAGIAVYNVDIPSSADKGGI